jgi:hypothetical protein
MGQIYRNQGVTVGPQSIADKIQLFQLSHLDEVKAP